MPIEITMPRLSDTMESGTVLKWNVQEGAAVSAGDVIADIETDKATMELTVYDDGTMAKILVPEGQAVDVGTTIAVMAAENEDNAAVAAGAGSAGAGGAAATAADGAGDPAGGGTATATAAPPAAPAARAPSPKPDAKPDARPSPAPARPAREGDRLRISPVARRIADEHGVDVSRLTGSGPGGRIIKRDVLGAAETAAETAASIAPAAQPAVGAPRVETTPVVATAAAGETGLATLASGRVPLSSMRQTIARRLVESSSSIPHYQVSMTIDMDPLLSLRKTINEQLASTGVKLSVNDFLVRGCALGMHQHPDINASWDEDAILIHGEVNIGIAIAVGPERGGGLVVGVINHADQKSLRAISVESRRLAEKARTRGLSIEEMTGSTFTLSNLGMFGVEHFTAIINPPNSAILAVGAALEKPVVRNGELVVGHEMTATLSSDHRVIDGAMAAQYLLTLKQMLENPASVMV